MSEPTPPGVPDHFRVALAGEAAALRGDHQDALARYREAMQMAVRVDAPEVFFRHYLGAALESLELIGAYAEVLEYCERAIAFYAANPPPHAIAGLDLATIHQRRGVVLLKSGDVPAARIALETALERAREAGADLELADRLLGWLRRGLTLSPDRVLSEQRRLRYFSVRHGTRRAAPARGARSGPEPPGPIPLTIPGTRND